MLRHPGFYLFMLCFMSQMAVAGDVVFQDDGIAIGGYDPVSYHTMQKATKGESQHTYRWNNTSWHFASQSNKDLFSANPEKYAPEYGGFCAYAVSKDALAPTDPHAWTVRDNKLYLNYSMSVRNTWKKNVENYIRLADKNWIRLKNQ